MASYPGSSLASAFGRYLRGAQLPGLFRASVADGADESDTLCDILCLIGRHGGSMRIKDVMASVCLTKAEFLDLMEDGIRRRLIRERDGAGGVELQLTSRGQELA